MTAVSPEILARWRPAGGAPPDLATPDLAPLNIAPLACLDVRLLLAWSDRPHGCDGWIQS